MEAILKIRGADPESALELAEDMVIDALFKVPAQPQSETRGHSKTHHSSNTTEGVDHSRARKRDRTNLEAVRRASL